MLGRIIAVPVVIFYYAVGIWGFILVERYVHDLFGFFGVVVSFFVFPLTYLLVPLYAGFVDGYWLPAIVCFAPVALYMFLSLIGAGVGLGLSAFRRD